ncbi:PQQ-dependent sugar dehydrogenase [Shewanella intestini]|uniref:L-sorbosone dehydrogenase n=1 Tax=Shewanella intestini TaxID=2017544 RepID=A0ABS5I175_9GAMM|nr:MULTISPECIES: PQQ-dependent sugar dehydrogenase [Shewanella]MBR9727671.1 L-sorbosone dehydrogenase [Shewanella intestini]MRG35179.1 L-sorbosone dehydrogenase [Shewanella sp. XMDDZSB0408]
MLMTGLVNTNVFAADSVTITVTKGFGISLYAADLGDIKQMALGDKGTLFVGSKKKGVVYALEDTDKDGKVDKRYVIAKGLEYPEAVAFNNGNLYVTEEDRIIRFSDIESRLRRPGRATEIFSGLPELDKKYTRAMHFGPDGRLYVAIGSPCNVCEAPAPFSSILAIDLVTGNSEQVAVGVRKATGFDWSPNTGKLWFADSGRNWMGDNLPPDEINRVDTKGSHYGFPYIHATSVEEPAYFKPKNLKVIPPQLELPAHVGPTGLHFYRGKQFPKRYQQQMFVAENGSWNRSSKVGYQIVMLSDLPTKKRETVVSFLDGEFPVARPFDLITALDGSMYISDDLKGNIYRLYYKNAEQSQEIK